tara:strand:- start:34139 stop:34633 length:495 start_codon:yes stop_codon:yes gene_type:complete
MNNTITFNNLDNSINNRIYERNLPSDNIKPSISKYPLGTKYTKFLILKDNQENYNLDNYNNFNSHKVFYPGTSKPPFQGFSNAIDNESELRNQNNKLQKSDLHLWAPSSNSNLYNSYINENTRYNGNNELLFNEEQFNNFNPNYNLSIGSELFNNSTRIQLKNL